MPCIPSFIEIADLRDKIKDLNLDDIDDFLSFNQVVADWIARLGLQRPTPPTTPQPEVER